MTLFIIFGTFQWCAHAASCRKLEPLNYSGNNLFPLMFDMLDAFC